MNSFKPENNDNFDEDYVSKSDLKRQMHALQALGESLIDLPKKQLQSLPISDELQEAIDIARDMKNNNGRRRQIQRIGKLMRFEDADRIKEQLQNTLKDEINKQKNIEAQKQKISDIYQSLLNSNEMLTQFFEQYPKANRQLLRQLIANIRKEKATADTQSSKNTKRLVDEITNLTIGN